jgi:hypothetical protein
MALLVGTLLALAVGLFSTVVGLDRDRGFYPTVMIVIASYYALFAVIGASPHALAVELLCGAVFLVGAVLGFKWSLWIVVAALASHGFFDFFHGAVVANSGVPAWWPQFCLAFDVSAAACLALLLMRGRIRSVASIRDQVE